VHSDARVFTFILVYLHDLRSIINSIHRLVVQDVDVNGLAFCLFILLALLCCFDLRFLMHNLLAQLGFDAVVASAVATACRQHGIRDKMSSAFLLGAQWTHEIRVDLAHAAEMREAFKRLTRF
jgi:hypothetical protein